VRAFPGRLRQNDGEGAAAQVAEVGWGQQHFLDLHERVRRRGSNTPEIVLAYVKHPPLKDEWGFLRTPDLERG
jgi:hypothetical protein